MRIAKIGPDLCWLLSLLRFVLSLCEQSEADPPGFLTSLYPLKNYLATTNGF